VRFFAFTADFAKFSVRQMHKYGFFSKILNAKVRFCQSLPIPFCLMDPGMSSLAFYPIRSGVMADQTFTGHCIAGA